ncbi:unnamed protein product [Gadus morhua 'NCC']
MCVDRPGPSLWPRHPALIRPATPRAEEPGPCMGVSTALHSYTIYVHIYRGPTGGLSPAQPYSPPAGQGPPGATEGECDFVFTKKICGCRRSSNKASPNELSPGRRTSEDLPPAPLRCWGTTRPPRFVQLPSNGPPTLGRKHPALPRA